LLESRLAGRIKNVGSLSIQYDLERKEEGKHKHDISLLYKVVGYSQI
jgi:uncharacterized beta-barrel protein YwiB (DUF1934 family)